MKRFLALLMVVLLLPLTALTEGVVIDLIHNPDAEYAFVEGAPLLEVVFPQIGSSDAIILRMGEDVMMVDAGYDDQRKEVAAALRAMGVTHIDTAFNTHPHYDHISGFEYVLETASIEQMLICYPENFNGDMKRAMRVMAQNNIPVRHMVDGELLTLGGAELTVIHREKPGFAFNDRSAVLMVQLGQRRLLLTADIENRAQAELVANPPACGLKADILKYPHHGHEAPNDKLWEMISPEFVVITAHEIRSPKALAYLERFGTPSASTWHGMLRLRTDGVIWVVDYMPTEETL